MVPRTTARARKSRARATFDPNLDKEQKMRPLKRHAVNKNRSAQSFRAKSRRTKAANIAGPMRGGIRL